MYVVVFCNGGPDSGLVYMSRKLSDDELLSESAFADQVAGSLGFMIAPDDGHIIPNCCGDIRVEFIDHEPRISGERYQGSSVIWSGTSYYFATE